MKLVCLITLVILVLPSLAEARQRKLLPAPRPATEASSLISSAAQVRVLALRVEFQPDNDPRTTGNGLFVVSGSFQQIDPPPHDSAYFASKLTFLQNYYQRVSNGQLTIQAEIFPQVISLPDTMAHYSPGTGSSNQPLGNLVANSWAAANAAIPSFPFSTFDAFIIFHAGVGRDIDLVSIFGFDPAPNDIPSLFLSLPTLRSFLNDPAYPGVPVNSGSFFITNSLVLPETETRVFTSGSVTDTLQLSINGLLAATFGNYLGLPDLFDTETGRSGIGQFGLMDGAAIFAFNGLFPPEPSAWEKIYLGWTTPLTIASGTSSLTLPAVGLTQVGVDTVYRIPISAREYFLIENRSRDPEKDGQTLTLLQQGVATTKYFSGDTTGFAYYDVSAIAGSLVDVQNPDWALPGSSLEPGFEGGGILIWHIDETDLAARIASNSVNRGRNDRAIDLEEADGSQDIGERYEFLEPGSGTEIGWPLDFWYSGNSSQVYKNVFDESSFPDSRANSGTRTLIRIDSFSPISPRMSAVVTQGNSRMHRVFQSSGLPGADHSIITVSDSGFFCVSPAGIFVLRADGSSRTNSPGGLVDTLGSGRPVAILEGSSTLVIGTRDSIVFIRELVDANSDGLFDTNTLTTVNLGRRATTHPVLVDSAGTTRIVVGTADGMLMTVALNGTVLNATVVDTTAIRTVLWLPATSGFPLGQIVTSTANAIFSETNSSGLPDRTDFETVRGIRLNGAGIVVTTDSPEGFASFDQQLSATMPSVRLSELPLSGLGEFRGLLPTDLNRDGQLDIVGSSAEYLFAFNDRGVLLTGFPVKLDRSVAGGPLLADLDGDGRLEVAVVTRSGSLWIVEDNGSVTSGFPVQMTDGDSASLAIYRTPAGMTGILVSTGTGGVDGWELNQAFGSIQGEWRQQFANPANTGAITFNSSGTQPVSADFLPLDRVYNWPNPVYGSSTRIRYYTSQPATISVKIVTIAGASVTELRAQSPGGVDGEVVWDVSGIESGIYFAKVEASGGGRGASKVIKIAVVK